MGAGTLRTIEPHTREGLSLAVRVLVREREMGGVGCAVHAA